MPSKWFNGRLIGSFDRWNRQNVLTMTAALVNSLFSSLGTGGFTPGWPELTVGEEPGLAGGYGPRPASFRRRLSSSLLLVHYTAQLFDDRLELLELLSSVTLNDVFNR
jgi:hypothetical protein